MRRKSVLGAGPCEAPRRTPPAQPAPPLCADGGALHPPRTERSGGRAEEDARESSAQVPALLDEGGATALPRGRRGTAASLVKARPAGKRAADHAVGGRPRRPSGAGRRPC